jgi:hypothetical protein
VALHNQISDNNYPNDPLLIGFTILKSCISGTCNIEYTICRQYRTSTENSIRTFPGYLSLNMLKLGQMKLTIPHVTSVTLIQITSLKKGAHLCVCLCLCQYRLQYRTFCSWTTCIWVSLIHFPSSSTRQNYATECPIYGISFVSTTVKNILWYHTHICHPQSQIPTNVTVSNEEQRYLAGRVYSMKHGLPTSPSKKKCTTNQRR